MTYVSTEPNLAFHLMTYDHMTNLIKKWRSTIQESTRNPPERKHTESLLPPTTGQLSTRRASSPYADMVGHALAVIVVDTG